LSRKPKSLSLSHMSFFGHVCDGAELLLGDLFKDLFDARFYSATDLFLQSYGLFENYVLYTMARSKIKDF